MQQRVNFYLTFFFFLQTFPFGANKNMILLVAVAKAVSAGCVPQRKTEKLKKQRKTEKSEKTGKKNKKLKKKTFPQVVYHSERLREGDPHLLPALCRLQELCEGAVSVCVLLVSCLPLEKLLPPTAMALPLVLHFPQYNRGEAPHWGRGSFSGFSMLT